MLPLWTLVFELFIVIMFGAFFRLDTTTLTNYTSFSGNLIFLLGTQRIIKVSRFSLFLVDGFPGALSVIFCFFLESAFNGTYFGASFGLVALRASLQNIGLVFQT